MFHSRGHSELLRMGGWWLVGGGWWLVCGWLGGWDLRIWPSRLSTKFKLKLKLSLAIMQKMIKMHLLVKWVEEKAEDAD